MRTGSIVLFVSASVLLAIAGFTSEARSVGQLAIAFGVLSVAAVVANPHERLIDVLLVAYAALAAFAAVLQAPTWLVVTSVALALTGWDAARNAQRIQAAQAGQRAAFARRYLARAAIVPACGVALVLLAGLIRVRLSFGPALAVAFTGLVVAALLIRLLRPAPADSGTEES